MTDTDDTRSRSYRAHAVFAALLILAPLAGIGAGMAATAASAQQNSTADYYNNTTATGAPASSSWLDGMGEASLDDVLSLLTRLPRAIIGAGPTTQGGGGPAGVLVVGFVFAAGGTGLFARSDVGSVGGATLFVVLAAGVVGLGYAPAWTWALILFGVGIVVATAYLRSV
jgi:hypothetical protein